jgi:hypothetical protein
LDVAASRICSRYCFLVFNCNYQLRKVKIKRREVTEFDVNVSGKVRLEMDVLALFLRAFP